CLPLHFALAFEVVVQQEPSPLHPVSADGVMQQEPSPLHQDGVVQQEPSPLHPPLHPKNFCLREEENGQQD
ncbi:MAG: hypothetical protein ACOX6Z_03635, partial [Dethiobacteria bacterium]